MKKKEAFDRIESRDGLTQALFGNPFYPSVTVHALLEHFFDNVNCTFFEVFTISTLQFSRYFTIPTRQ